MQSIPPEFLPQWASLVASLKPAPSYRITHHDEPVDDETFPTEEEAADNCSFQAGYGVSPVMIQLTVGFTPADDDKEASWSYQTGDNSYSGGAYGHPVWGVVWISADSLPDEVASEIAADIESQLD